MTVAKKLKASDLVSFDLAAAGQCVPLPNPRLLHTP